MSVIGLEHKSVEDQAREMAIIAQDDDPAVLRTYWIPASDEVRLIHVDETTSPSRQIEPFYSGRNVSDGVPYCYAIALIRPEEDGHLALPAGWGTWADAITLKTRP